MKAVLEIAAELLGLIWLIRADEANRLDYELLQVMKRMWSHVVALLS
jgi:hypothetical protein